MDLDLDLHKNNERAQELLEFETQPPPPGRQEREVWLRPAFDPNNHNVTLTLTTLIRLPLFVIGLKHLSSILWRPVLPCPTA